MKNEDQPDLTPPAVAPRPAYLTVDPHRDWLAYQRLGVAYIPSDRNEIGQRAVQTTIFDLLD